MKAAKDLPPTEKQTRLLLYLEQQLADNQRLPTVLAIAGHFKCSPSNIRQCLHALRVKGFLALPDESWRSYILTKMMNK